MSPFSARFEAQPSEQSRQDKSILVSWDSADRYPLQQIQFHSAACLDVPRPRTKLGLLPRMRISQGLTCLPELCIACVFPVVAVLIMVRSAFDRAHGSGSSLRSRRWLSWWIGWKRRNSH
eukprot:1848096-Prorocentrum_lima.AAC.1